MNERERAKPDKVRMKRGQFLRGAWLTPFALVRGRDEEPKPEPEIRQITVHGDGVVIANTTIKTAHDQPGIRVLPKLTLPASDPATWRYRA